jgi:hypothetical protein
MFSEFFTTVFGWAGCLAVGFGVGFYCSAQPRFAKFSPLSVEAQKLRDELAKAGEDQVELYKFVARIGGIPENQTTDRTTALQVAKRIRDIANGYFYALLRFDPKGFEAFRGKDYSLFFHVDYAEYFHRYLSEIAADKAAERNAHEAVSLQHAELEKRFANLEILVRTVSAERDEALATSRALRSHLVKLEPETVHQIERATSSTSRDPAAPTVIDN